MDSFFSKELCRGLTEQGLAICSFEVIDAEPLQAVAHVKILEGDVLQVSLTHQGYKVELPAMLSYRLITLPKMESKPNKEITQTFETIEDLLRSISPLYVQRHNEMLFEALKQLP